MSEYPRGTEGRVSRERKLPDGCEYANARLAGPLLDTHVVGFAR